MSAGPRLRNVDLDVRRSEIVGVSGLEGQGQRELFYALAGFLRMSSGKVQLSRGEGPSSGAKAVLDRHERRPDLVLVPEERKTEGLFTQMSSQFNLTISHLQALRRAKLIKRRAERAFAKQAANSINLSPLLLSKPVSALSGGNQQKIVLGRAILSRPRCLLLFDPTRGVDASTKTEIYTMIRKYAEGGGAVLMYSTEIPELVGLCDRTYTMYNGGIWVEHKGEKVTNESVLAATLGHSTAQGSA
jgi:ribose transport system ATP-binding protein